MRATHGMLKRIAKLGLSLIIGASMNTEAGLFGFGGDSWKEEVLLHDGSKVIVERSVERGGRHEIGQQPPYKEQSLSFTMPGTNQKIVWEDKFSEDLGAASFLPMLLDIYEGATYLIAYPMGCLSYNKWGRPNPPYVIFKHDGKEWQRIALQELPAEIKTPNLIFSDPDNVAKKIGSSLIPAETIQQIISRYRQPEYKSILREPYPGAGGSRCGPMVHYKCGWFGANPDGTFNKEFADRMCNK
jgi:hypothetical protein